jgi:predicted MPP superfamily phosphohydrolase
MLLINRKHMNEFIFLSDVIVIVGDLVDGLVTDLKDAVQPLQNLKSKHGVLYVTGKKEYQEEKTKMEFFM